MTRDKVSYITYFITATLIRLFFSHPFFFVVILIPFTFFRCILLRGWVVVAIIRLYLSPLKGDLCMNIYIGNIQILTSVLKTHPFLFTVDECKKKGWL